MRTLWRATLRVTVLWGAVALHPALGASYGLHGGVQFGTADFDNLTADNGRVGFSGGLNLELPLPGPFYAQLEANYAQRGATLGPTVLSLDYVEVPLLIKLKGNPGKYFPVSLEAGASLDLNVRSNVASGTQRLAYSALFGLTFECYLESDTHLFVSLRYQLGLSPAVEESGLRVTTRGLQAILGLRFDTYTLYPWDPRTDRVDRFKERRGDRADHAKRRPDRRFYRGAAPVVRSDDRDDLPVARRESASRDLRERRSPKRRRGDALIPDEPISNDLPDLATEKDEDVSLESFQDDSYDEEEP